MVTVPAAGAPADFVGTTIVLVGDFDPMQVQPSILLAAGLLGEDDLADLRYEVLAPEISVLKLPWMELIVEPSKLTAATTMGNPVGELVRDFVVGFCNMIPVKKLTAMGLNHDTHFGVSSEEAWHRVGDKLAPKDELWRKILRAPGMRSLTIKGERDSALPGYVNVKVEPSLRIQPGIYINVNDHFAKAQLQPGSPLEPLGEPAQLVGLGWSESQRRSDDIVAAIKGLVS